MKTLKVTLFVFLFAIVGSTEAKAQNYATLNYWGQNIKLDRHFFELLNSRYSLFMKNTPGKYYDFEDYNDIYIKIVTNLKSPSFEIIVDEANQLRYSNEDYSWPNSNVTNKDKKNRNRAGWVYYQVILPSLQEFAKDKI